MTQTWKPAPDRKSTRLNSSHDQISYAVFCLKKKKKKCDAVKANRHGHVAEGGEHTERLEEERRTIAEPTRCTWGFAIDKAARAEGGDVEKRSPHGFAPSIAQLKNAQ